MAGSVIETHISSLSDYRAHYPHNSIKANSYSIAGSSMSGWENLKSALQ